MPSLLRLTPRYAPESMISSNLAKKPSLSLMPTNGRPISAEILAISSCERNLFS